MSGPMPKGDDAGMTGAAALVGSLKAHGVDTIFGLPGVQLDHVFDALHGERESIRVLHPRHEQATAYMAFGYAQVTGRVGTCLVVPGPGVLNAIAALSTAYACNAPVLCLTGQIPSRFIDKGLGLLHEIPNQPGALACVSKWQGRATRPGEVSPIIQEAFVQLNSGRRRPVAVEVPPDVTAARDATTRILPPLPATPDPRPNDDLVERAARMLGEARAPAIFVGSGVFGAEAELRELAEMLEAPVIMSQHGLGALDWRHPLAQNLQVGNDIWPTVDVALAVGTRFLSPMVDWGRDDNVRLIRVDIDPEQSLWPWRPDVHIVSSARDALAALVDRARRHNRSRKGRTEELKSIKQASAERLAAALAPQHAYATAIRRQLPDDAIVCFGVTQLGFYSWWGFPVHQPRTMIQPGYQGTLGYSFPTALGAKVALPDRKVVCVVGDGGFMFNVQELATATLHAINLVTIVFNDNAFGNVRRTQKEAFGERYIASHLRNPDFMKLADAFGVMGRRVSSPDQLEIALRDALSVDAPVLIEVQVGEMPNPFNYIPKRRVRGVAAT